MSYERSQQCKCLEDIEKVGHVNKISISESGICSITYPLPNSIKITAIKVDQQFATELLIECANYGNRVKFRLLAEHFSLHMNFSRDLYLSLYRNSIFWAFESAWETQHNNYAFDPLMMAPVVYDICSGEEDNERIRDSVFMYIDICSFRSLFFHIDLCKCFNEWSIETWKFLIERYGCEFLNNHYGGKMNGFDVYAKTCTKTIFDDKNYRGYALKKLVNRLNEYNENLFVRLAKYHQEAIYLMILKLIKEIPSDVFENAVVSSKSDCSPFEYFVQIVCRRGSIADLGLEIMRAFLAKYSNRFVNYDLKYIGEKLRYNDTPQTRMLLTMLLDNKPELVSNGDEFVELMVKLFGDHNTRILPLMKQRYPQYFNDPKIYARLLSDQFGARDAVQALLVYNKSFFNNRKFINDILRREETLGHVGIDDFFACIVPDSVSYFKLPDTLIKEYYFLSASILMLGDGYLRTKTDTKKSENRFFSIAN